MSRVCVPDGDGRAFWLLMDFVASWELGKGGDASDTQGTAFVSFMVWRRSRTSCSLRWGKDTEGALEVLDSSAMPLPDGLNSGSGPVLALRDHGAGDRNCGTKP